jgi:hypothetical protein
MELDENRDLLRDAWAGTDLVLPPLIGDWREQPRRVGGACSFRLRPS